MPQTDKTKDYLLEVCSHIRWKRAHDVVSRELEAHIEDQREAFVAAGMDEAAADGRAVEEMGDAAIVGSLLDRSYRPKPAWGIIAITAVLMIFGFLSRLYVTSQIESNDIYYMTAVFVKSLSWTAAAIAALITGYFLDFTVLVKYPRVTQAAYYAILALTMFYAIATGSRINGRLYTYAHYLLMLFPPVFSGTLCSLKGRGYRDFVGCCVCIAAAVVIGAYIPAFSVILTCWSIGLLLLTFALMKGFFRISKPVGLAIMYLPPVFLFIRLFEPITHRLNMALHPETDMYGAGFVGTQIKGILGGAGMLGEGGYTPVKNFLPSAHTEFVLTFYIHKTGWISFIIIVALFLGLFTAACVLVRRQKNRLGQMVSAAVLLVLMAEFIIYVISNLGFTMFASLSLPLVSSGNSALVTNAFLIGLMLSVFRTGDLVCDARTDPAAAKAGGGHAGEIRVGRICIKIAVTKL